MTRPSLRRSRGAENEARRLPAGVIALSGFFLFGTAMSFLTCIALLFPGSRLEPVWRLNPQAHEAFLQMGPWAIGLMAIVCLACAFSARGLWIRARWGHRLALGVLAVNLIGDAMNAILRGDLRTLIGLPIGGVLIAYLLSARVKSLFHPQDAVPPGATIPR
jgi:hypothetical protein